MSNTLLYRRELPDGRVLFVYWMLFSDRLCIGDDTTLDDGWCYQQRSLALVAAEEWDGAGDPPGPWIKHVGTNEARCLDCMALYASGDPHECAPVSNWNQPICGSCWQAYALGAKGSAHIEPVRVLDLKERPPELCCTCGGAAKQGIYVRAHPSKVLWPAAER